MEIHQTFRLNAYLLALGRCPVGRRSLLISRYRSWSNSIQWLWLGLPTTYHWKSEPNRLFKKWNRLCRTTFAISVVEIVVSWSNNHEYRLVPIAKKCVGVLAIQSVSFFLVLIQLQPLPTTNNKITEVSQSQPYLYLSLPVHWSNSMSN